MSDKPQVSRQMHQEFSEQHPDPLIRSLHGIIRISVKLLSVLMVFVILFGVADVIYVLYSRLMAPPFMLLDVSDIFKVFNVIYHRVSYYLKGCGLSVPGATE